MLTFNQLLERAGLNPAEVRLLRHKDPESATHRLIFDAAMKGDPRFVEYQEVQGASQVVDAFRSTRYLASFVVDPTTKYTVFVGVWERVGERPAPTVDAFGTPLKGAPVAFETRVVPALESYRGRIAIDWGPGERAWVQRADNQDKAIVEIRRVREDPRFPGYTTFQLPLDEVEGIPVSWSEALRNARGIYLLVHRQSGDQYVGSAYGQDGFFGRWKCYADGHGGNVAMRELGAAASAYDATILEVVSSDALNEDIFVRENLWKSKLGTRARGLNRN
jgi:hypothetical protein